MVGTFTHMVSDCWDWDDRNNLVKMVPVRVGDQLTVKFGNGEAAFDVIGINTDAPANKEPGEHCYITIQMHDLLLNRRPFDDNGCGTWETSSIRQYLNSGQFRNLFSLDFLKRIVPVIKNNGSSAPTIDTFFLLSKSEFASGATPYPFYYDRRNLLKFTPDITPEWHWTRSVNRSDAGYAWYVNSTGSVTLSHAGYAYRFAPACVVKLY